MSRYYGDIQTREPEKTPLIDMVFLLLVFFFVNLAVRSQPTATLSSNLPADVQVELPKAPGLDLPRDSTMVLFELLDLHIASNLNRLTAIREQIQTCLVRCKQPPLPDLAVSRFWMATTPLDSLETALNALRSGCVCGKVRRLVASFPIPLSDRRLRAKLSQRLSIRLATLPQNVGVKLHVRLPKSAPVTVLQTLYDLVNSTDRLNPKYIFVRALEEKTG